MELIFAGRPVISGRLANRNGSRIGANKKKIAWSYCPSSTPNDYLDTVVDDVVSQRWSKKNALPRSPRKSLLFFSRLRRSFSRASRANFSWLRRSRARLDKTTMLRRLQFDGILSLRVKSLSVQDDKKGMLFVDRPVK